MSYRNLPIVVEHRKWDLLPFGPTEYKLVFWWHDAPHDRQFLATSPIVAPLDLLDRVLDGFVPAGPVEFEVWSGKIYQVHGELKRCPAIHSAIAMRLAAKKPEPLLKRIVSRVFP